jgi:hypothetical protein
MFLYYNERKGARGQKMEKMEREKRIRLIQMATGQGDEHWSDEQVTKEYNTLLAKLILVMDQKAGV